MKKIFALLLIGLVLAGCSKKETDSDIPKSPEIDQNQQQQSADPAAIDLANNKGQANVQLYNLPADAAKELKITNPMVVMIVPRNAIGVNAVSQLASEKGRSGLPKDVQDHLNNNKRAIFALATDNRNAQAAANVVYAALQNCSSDSKADILIFPPAAITLPENTGELLKKCHVNIISAK